MQLNVPVSSLVPCQLLINVHHVQLYRNATERFQKFLKTLTKF